MARAASVAVLWLLLASSSSSSGVQELHPAHANLGTPAAKLLDESYALSSQLEEADRIRYLGDLVINSPNIHPERVEEWSRELNSSSRNSHKILPWDRIANQKIAVVVLSKFNPVAAMEIFSQIGPPERNPEGRLPEDVRAFGARALFLNYFRALGLRSLPKIQQEAEKLFRDGAYPFHAISLVIGEIGGKDNHDATQANQIFGDALKYYRCGSEVENQDSEFLTFLQNTRNVVSKELFTTGIHRFVNNLTNPVCDKRSKIDRFEAVIKTSKGTVRLTDTNKTLLFRSFGLIQEEDPSFAMDLQKANPELADADATIIQVAGSFVDTGLPSEEQAARQKRGLQLSLLRSIRNMQQSDPNAALQIAQTLEDQDSRIMAISSILPSLAQRAPDQAKQFYARELLELDSVKDESQRVQAALSLAQTAYHIGDLDNFQYWTTSIFSDAIRRFEMSYTATNNAHAETPVDDRPGYKELTELVEFSAAHDISWPLDEVRKLTNIRLRVYLLMFAAKGLAGHPL